METHASLPFREGPGVPASQGPVAPGRSDRLSPSGLQPDDLDESREARAGAPGGNAPTHDDDRPASGTFVWDDAGTGARGSLGGLFAEGRGQEQRRRANDAYSPFRSPYADPAQAERMYRLGAPLERRLNTFTELPLWRQVARFRFARQDSLTQRRDGLRRLVLWVTNWLTAQVKDRGGIAPDPHWEPSREVAEVLEISEGHLNRLCREQGGASAREIWDKLRFGTFLGALRAEIERMLDGRAFVPATKKNRAPDRFAQVLTALRSARREEGWTRLAFAWRLGFSHFARMNLAAFRVHSKSVQALEADVLRDLAATWHFDDQRCIISRQAPAAPKTAPVDMKMETEKEARAQARAEAWAAEAPAGTEPAADTGGADQLEDSEAEDEAEHTEALQPERYEHADPPKSNAHAEPLTSDAQATLRANDAEPAPTPAKAKAAPRRGYRSPRKAYPHVEPYGRFAIYRPSTQEGPPKRFSEGRADLLNHLPRLGGLRQREATTEMGPRVRVFANAEEVWKYLMHHGFFEDQIEAFARQEKKPLDEFLEQYVRHGMKILYPLYSDLPLPP